MLRQRTEEALEEHENPTRNQFEESPVSLFLSTGCSLLNLAFSDRVDGGWPCGRIVNPIGDSDTGKSVLGMTALAEAALDERFNEHSLIYGDVESALTCHKLFSKAIQDRITFQSPFSEEKAPESIEEFHYTLMDLIKIGDPFVYVLDSFDALPSRQELEETKKAKKAFEDDKETSGSYQASKQKYAKKMFREVKEGIAGTNSLVIIISQTIANLSIGSIFNPKAVAGGSALEFFSRIRFWLSKKESYKIRDREIGRLMKCKVSKNHITGKKRTVPMWVFENIGIDDIRTSINFLCEEEVWRREGKKATSKTITVPDGPFAGTWNEKDLIPAIEDTGVDYLKQTLQITWDEIEDSLKQERKSRYV